MDPHINNDLLKSKWRQLQVQLRHEIVESLEKCNFREPVPVQSAAVPLMLKNYDLAVEAQTGSGKTLAFVIPLLERYLALPVPPPKIFIKFMLISPTRELCQQTYSVIKKLLENLPDRKRGQAYLEHIKCATGGNQIKLDIEEVGKKAIVLIGTVGRLKELAGSFESNWLKKVDYLYIDEADRVLKEKGINELIRAVQKIRRTAMFSATLQGLQQKDYQFYGMRNLAKIALKTVQPKPEEKSEKSNAKSKPKSEQKVQQITSAYTIPGSLSNTYMLMPNRMEKIKFLFFFLQTYLVKSKSIVFFNTCASVEFYSKLFGQFLAKNNPESQNLVFGIHGKLKNNRRARIIKQFTENQNGCLFSTDVTSRGIDFDRIHYIVQVDPPEDPDNYIHRIGRTARINRPGVAILMIEEHEEAFIQYLANKNVGVQLIDQPSHFVKNYDRKYEKELPEMLNVAKDIILSDRDYVEKSKKAFVSYIRSYTEHDLKYIFEFKNLSIGYTAQSFFLLRIPRIKEILGKKIDNFQQSEIDPETVPWKNRNQELQYQKKKQKLNELREARDRQKALLDAKLDIKNKKSQRKKVKAKRQKLESKSLRKDYSELKRERKNRNNISMLDSDASGEESEDFMDEDTEQIEERLGVNK